MKDVWDERAEAYRTSVTHATDADLDLVVAFCEPSPGRTALDVATGGGHVARRLREVGVEVTTADASPGMEPDVVCQAEKLPFADGDFDVVVTRIAPHHFTDVRAAVREMARVTRDSVVIEDTLFISDDHELAEKLRDPSHVRSYSEAEWLSFVEDAGLEVERVEHFVKTHDTEDWLARTGCAGETAERVRTLLAPVASDDGATWQDTKLILEARKVN
ncbi:MAG TPA: class I SAM-dependent methyltransferase [Gaiellaceae bacterium]|nr:class I SAM-dependent methyltransferase [Gaiellaceae bacterium]